MYIGIFTSSKTEKYIDIRLLTISRGRTQEKIYGKNAVKQVRNGGTDSEDSTRSSAQE